MFSILVSEGNLTPFKFLSMFEALQNPISVTTMKVEMDALQANETWELVPLQPGEKTVGCKWVFNVK